MGSNKEQLKGARREYDGPLVLARALARAPSRLLAGYFLSRTSSETWRILPPGSGRYMGVVIKSAYMYIVLIRWLTCLDVAYQCVLYILIGKSAD